MRHQAVSRDEQPRIRVRARETARRMVLGSALLGVIVFAAGARSANAQAGTLQQSFQLQPGWNSIYLEVQPDPDSIEAAFAGIPVASVWTWHPDQASNQFVQDPSEELLNLPGWLGFFPRDRPEHFLTNLFTLQANHPYLIKLGGSQAVTWKIRGRPQIGPETWQQDAFNLKGFPVDAGNPPSFGAYFAGEKALAGQPVYRLAADGHWQLVGTPFSTTIHAGEAYWVYCNGPSKFHAPLDVSIDFGREIDFGGGLDSSGLELVNNSPVDADIQIRSLSGAGTVPLVYQLTDEDTGELSYPDLPSALTLPTPTGADVQVLLGIRRAAMTAPRMDTVLEVKDGLGTRIWVAVGGNTIQAPAAAASTSTRRELAQRASNNPYAGLWVGEAKVDSVSQAQLAGTKPTATGKSFPIRLIIHVDSNGQARLLKDVIQMWQDGTMAPDPLEPGYMTTAVPGHYVLITNQALLPNFSGAALRDGESVGLRVSTAAYDFSGENLSLTGDFSPTGTITWTMVLPATAPTNPFYDRYHPDHDNLDALYLHTAQESFEITRNVRLQFTAEQPEGESIPQWGSTILGGTYYEELQWAAPESNLRQRHLPPAADRGDAGAQPVGIGGRGDGQLESERSWRRADDEAA